MSIFASTELGKRSQFGCLAVTTVRDGRLTLLSGTRSLSANMSETVTPWKFSVEGEAGLESDERIGAGPRWAGDRGGGEGDAAAVPGGGQAEDRPGGRRLQDAGRGRGGAAAGGAGLRGPDD